MTSYHLRHKGRVRGPFTLEQLRQLHAEGRLPPSLEISEGDDLFYPLSSMRYLFEEPPAAREAPSVAGGRGGAPPRPAPGRGVQGGRGPVRARRRAGSPEGRRGRPGEDEAVPRRPRGPGSGKLTAALVLGAAATLVVLVAAVVDQWVRVAMDAPVSSGAVLVLRLEFGSTSCAVSLDTGDVPLDARQGQALSRWTRGELLPYADPGAWEGLWRGRLAGVSRAQLDQTRLLGLAMLGKLGVGAMAGLAAGIAGRRTGKAPGGLGATTVMAGLLGAVCVVCFRLLGVFSDPADRDAVEVLLGPSFWSGLAGGLLIVTSGVLVIAGGKGPSLAQWRRRRGRW